MDLLRGLERRLTALEEDMGRYGSALLRKQSRKPQRDDPYPCEACQHVLGWYNREADQLRVSHLGMVVSMKLGPGGEVTLVCPTCGEVSMLSTDLPFSGEIELRPDGSTTLSVDTLRELLAQAERNGGVVTLAAGQRA